jgi:hypothetical protein
MTADDHGLFTAVAHDGPIEPGCPLGCLRSVVSAMALNRLEQALDEPQTVGQVLDLRREGKLGDIRGLRPKPISEIGAALVFVGLDIPAAMTTGPSEGYGMSHAISGDGHVRAAYQPAREERRPSGV